MLAAFIPRILLTAKLSEDHTHTHTHTHTHIHAKVNCVHSKDNTAQLKTPQFPTFTFSSTCIYRLSTVARVQQASKLGCSIAISLETPERDRRQMSGTRAVNLGSRQYWKSAQTNKTDKRNPLLKNSLTMHQLKSEVLDLGVSMSAAS